MRTPKKSTDQIREVVDYVRFTTKGLRGTYPWSMTVREVRNWCDWTEQALLHAHERKVQLERAEKEIARLKATLAKK
jgi:hypothetical protein